MFNTKGFEKESINLDRGSRAELVLPIIDLPGQFSLWILGRVGKKETLG